LQRVSAVNLQSLQESFSAVTVLLAISAWSFCFKVGVPVVAGVLAGVFLCCHYLAISAGSFCCKPGVPVVTGVPARGRLCCHCQPCTSLHGVSVVKLESLLLPESLQVSLLSLSYLQSLQGFSAVVRIPVVAGVPVMLAFMLFLTSCCCWHLNCCHSCRYWGPSFCEFLLSWHPSVLFWDYLTLLTSVLLFCLSHRHPEHQFYSSYYSSDNDTCIITISKTASQVKEPRRGLLPVS
jgi:hypothetical protein